MTDLNLDQLLSSYNYELPEELIAQSPAVPRDSSRLLVVHPSEQKSQEKSPYTHTLFRNLTDFLLPGDLLVLNNTRVMPARLYGKKSTGVSVEVLLLEEKQQNCWLALVKPGKRLPPGATITFERQVMTISEKPLIAQVLERDAATGGRLLQFEVPAGMTFVQLLEEFGHLPLPPYITSPDSQPEQYQTVYADRLGAVAAPTAGLHFTNELFDRLQKQGIEQAFLTLHVGIGTFRPVEVEKITDHKMHSEWVEVPESTVEKIRQTKARGGRIIAVGTTVTRSLEAAAATGELQPYCGKTDLFIYPGYQWRVVDGLITNFHLPQSSLLMLVSALIGRQRLLALYAEAIAQGYRFYSFGDAMLILPNRGVSD